MSEHTGILDQTTEQVLVLTDDRVTIRSNVKIHGTLDVGLIRTTEIIADSRFDKKFLTFHSPDLEIAGTGLLWHDRGINKELTYRRDPDRFFFSDHIELPSDKAILMAGTPILTYNALSPTVTESRLQHVGTLKSLTVNGKVNIDDYIVYNPISQRLGIGTDVANGMLSIYSAINDVELVLDTNSKGRGVIGTYNSRGLELVTGSYGRLFIEANGYVNVGIEDGTSGLFRVFGKIGINVKNPQEDLEIANSFKFSNKKFFTGVRPPSTGSFNKGDICWNDNPIMNSYIGWVCLANGNPGVWHPFGLIPPS